MRTWQSRSLRAACVAAAMVVMAAPDPAGAQVKLQRSPGGYHGELDFPISWKQYYSYDEWTGIMKEIQARYPGLADIQSIGQSRMGRDQFLLTLTAKATGAHDAKPALWVDGAIHGNEANGITCSLYVMWYLLTRYDYDPFVHELLNTTTFYILPGLNVDANESFVTLPNTPNNPREPFRPEDNDGDGLYDEDQTEDVDGDGELSIMYMEDPSGPFKLSPDGRRFVPVTDESERVVRFRRIGAEGYDNDGDGRINEDDIGGPDPNRNFPYGWNLRDGNPYPLSEPETRNVYEFQRTHPNIFAAFHFHNTGRLIMFSAPPAAADQGGQAAARGGSVEERLERMREDNRYAQLFDRQVPAEYQHDMDVQTAMVTTGARLLKNYRPTISGLSGQAQAASYYMLGAYSYLIELWGSPVDVADVNGDGRVDDEEVMQWIDLELHGEGWVVPHRFDHPDLGEVWIGGTQKKHTVRTPPARYMEMEAQKNADFVLYVASQFPRVEIESIRVTPEADNLFWVDVTVTNERVYPTSSDRANVLGMAVPDRLLFQAASGVRLLEIPGERTRVDPVPGSPSPMGVGQPVHEFRLHGRDSQTFRYLVEASRGGWVEFEVESIHGGKATARTDLRSGG